MNNRVLSLEEEREYKTLKELFAKYTSQLFVYGESDSKNASGFPDKITVCQGSGMATYATYSLVKDKNEQPNMDL